MQCAEVMKTDVVTVTPGDTVHVAARRMRDADVGFLPVCDAEGKVLGTLTDRDVAIRLVADDLPGTCAVENVMSREVVACRPGDEIAHVEQLMAEYRKSRIIVTDEAGRLFGVISLSDVARLEEGPRRTATTMRRVASRETRL